MLAHQIVAKAARKSVSGLEWALSSGAKQWLIMPDNATAGDCQWRRFRLEAKRPRA